MKKLISLITIIALLIATLTIFASCGGNAGPASVEATKYENITWSYDSGTKTLKIVGDNNDPVEMTTIEKGKAPWYTLRNSALKLEISGVKKISDFAFYSMYLIKEISFDDSVTEIGKCAFAFCASLTELKNLPEGLTTIGESAFEGCANLKTVILPQSVTALGERAFGYDHALTDITLSESLKDIVSDNKVLEGIENAPKFNYVALSVEGDSTDSDATDSNETTESNDATEDATETEDVNETEKNTETEAPAQEKTNDTATIIAIIVLALVIVGIIVGAILLMRSNKNQTKDSRTVRKSDDEKNSKNGKKSNYNKNSKSKGKKK